MKIKQVFCESTKEIMSVEEVSKHDNHDVIKHDLICATDGCNARISFVSGSAGRRDHFRKIRFEEHSSHCRMQSVKAELKENKKISEQIAVSLDEKAIARRIRYFYNKRSGKYEKAETRRSPLKRKTSRTQTVSSKKTVLGSNDDPSLDTIKKNNRASAPQIPTRTLNQISAADEGKFIQLSATIKEVRKKKNSYELDLFDRNNSATLIVTESFIKGSRDVQIIDYLNSLITFTSNNEIRGNIYNVTIFVFCMFDKYQKDSTIIFANNFDQFYLSISGKRPVPVKLDTFQALLTRGSWQ